MKNLSRLSLFIVLLLTLPAWANGQTAISEQKRKLILELIVVTKTEEEFLKSADTTMANMELSYPATIKSALEGMTELSAREREEMERSMIERYLSISKKVRSRLPQLIDMKQVINEVYIPLYDKYYTESEIKDLITFYGTPTGKKVIEKGVLFFAETVKLIEEKINPKVRKIVEDIAKELDGAGPPAPEKKNN